MVAGTRFDTSPEVGYLLARDADSSVESRFLRSFKTGFLDIVSPTADDLVLPVPLKEV